MNSFESRVNRVMAFLSVDRLISSATRQFPKLTPSITNMAICYERYFLVCRPFDVNTQLWKQKRMILFCVTSLACAIIPTCVSIFVAFCIVRKTIFFDDKKMQNYLLRILGTQTFYHVFWSWS